MKNNSSAYRQTPNESQGHRHFPKDVAEEKEGMSASKGSIDQKRRTQKERILKDLEVASFLFPSPPSLSSHPFYRMLKDHLSHRSRQITERVLSKLSSIPEFLREAIELVFADSPEEEDESELEFPENPTVVKFEIIEEFVRNNDFAWKAAWDEKLAREYRLLVQYDVFPSYILSAYAGVLKDVKEMTQQDMQSIRAIIME